MEGPANKEAPASKCFCCVRGQGWIPGLLTQQGCGAAPPLLAWRGCPENNPGTPPHTRHAAMSVSLVNEPSGWRTGAVASVVRPHARGGARLQTFYGAPLRATAAAH